MIVLVNELLGDNLSEMLSVHTSNILLLLLSVVLSFVSFVMRSNSFKAVPVGPLFSLFTAYIFLTAGWDKRD